jgi:menaquinol-cytochrome c reductase iron-sulfur subunit
LYEPVKKNKLGKVEDFPEGIKFFPDERLFVIREGNKFWAISAICTHLACTVNLEKYSSPKTVKLADGTKLVENFEFPCPCHGSKFRGDGTVYAGPAPRDLPWWEIMLSPDGQIVVDAGKEIKKGTIKKFNV